MTSTTSSNPPQRDLPRDDARRAGGDDNDSDSSNDAAPDEGAGFAAANESLRAATSDLAEAAIVMAGQLKRTLDVAQNALASAAEEHPLKLVAGAAGVGFVVGGGVASSITKTAMRVAGAFVVEAALDALLTGKSSGLRRATSPEGAPDPTTSTSTAE
jgi:hypothetical protein